MRYISLVFFFLSSIPCNGQEESSGVVIDKIISKIDDLLAAANCSKSDLVKVTVLMVDIDDYSKVNEIYGKWLGDSIPPARAAYAVNSLPLGALVEIICEAVRNSGDYRTDLPAELEEALV